MGYGVGRDVLVIANAIAAQLAVASKEEWSGMMREHWQKLPHHASKHPLIAGFLIFVFIVALGLGVIHECRLAGEILIVVVRHTKHELAALGDVWNRLKREVSSSGSAAEGKAAAKTQSEASMGAPPVNSK